MEEVSSISSSSSLDDWCRQFKWVVVFG